MNIVDLLIAVVVVTILVTIILAVVTYVAYKLRLSREPTPRDEDPNALRYFVSYDPAAASASEADSTLGRLDRDVAELEGHAAEA